LSHWFHCLINCLQQGKNLVAMLSNMSMEWIWALDANVIRVGSGRSVTVVTDDGE
jgi:hypothetical protein